MFNWGLRLKTSYMNELEGRLRCVWEIPWWGNNSWCGVSCRLTLCDPLGYRELRLIQTDVQPGHSQTDLIRTWRSRWASISMIHLDSRWSCIVNTSLELSCIIGVSWSLFLLHRAQGLRSSMFKGKLQWKWFLIMISLRGGTEETKTTKYKEASRSWLLSH